MSPRRPSVLNLEHVLLALLEQKPMHGYELYQELCALPGISKVWNITQATLYALLEKLEGGGYLTAQQIQSETHPPRKVYHLTEAGRQSLHAWIKTPVRRARDLRQEFLAKLVIARRYGKPAMLDLLEAQERVCRAWRDDLRAQSPEDLDERLVYSYRLHRVEAVLDWLALCGKELDRLPG